MKITSEKNIRNFEFWSGAKETARALTLEQLDTVETVLEDLYPDGIDETQLNDIFWFEEDWIAEILGFESFEALEAANENE